MFFHQNLGFRRAALASVMVAAACLSSSCTEEPSDDSGGSGTGATSGTSSAGRGGSAQGGTAGTASSGLGGMAGSGMAGVGGTGAAGMSGGGAGGGAGNAQAGTAGGTTEGGSSGSGAIAGGDAGAGIGGAGTGNAGGSPPVGGSSSGGSGGNTTDPTVRLDQPKQTIDGFGINDTWRALTDSQARELFDPDEGIGLTILRVGMSPNGNFYNNNEANSIAAAKRYGATTIIGSVWSPPANCKTNNNTQKGGHLLTSCYESWSDSIANFADVNDLYAMSAGNEPDFASCAASIGPPCTVEYDTTLYTAKEMVAFVKVLGPKLAAVGVKLIAPEASEWIHFWSNTSATGSTVASHPNSSDPLNCGCFGTSTDCAAHCLEGDGYDYGHWLYNDAAAWGAVDIIGVHQYDTQVAEPWPADVPDRKPVWQTEMSGVKYWPEGEPSKDIDNGIKVAGWLHNALTVGEANAWLWWWYQGQDTNEGLYLADGSDTKRHYTFGNYTKFIRPGYVRVDVTGTFPPDLSLSAYKGADGTVVVVAINAGSANAIVPLTIAGGTAPASMIPNVTSATEDLEAGTAVPVTDGLLMASLPGKTVTTFVGR
jgi:glucuronoarabinoxylan endo-1,4-beta-xylanase